MQTKKIFLAGMPGSGKTAYVGATWNMMIDGSVSTILSKKPDYMPDEYTRIDKIAKQLLTYKELERTKESDNAAINVVLCDAAGNEVQVDIPDLAGEIFRDLVRDRRIKKETASRLIQSDCVLFFIYYKNMSTERRITSNVDEKDNNLQNLYLSNQEVNKNREANQSEIVELLQAILELLGESSTPVTVRFVLSAWDMVEKENNKDICPKDFLQKQFPLLYQCILSNSERMNAEFWGISALGGDFNNQADVDRLQKEEFNAVKVISPDGICSNDLTALLVGIGENK